MDQALVRFRKAAARENRGRRDIRRRYSPTLQQQAVHYWRARRAEGDGLRDVAVALGVAPWSLFRWTRQGQTRRRFHPVQVVAPEPPRAVIPASSQAASINVVLNWQAALGARESR